MRLNSIDIIRGICVIGMVSFHANYMLEEIFDSSILTMPYPLWFIIGRSVAIAFILISGFSLFLTHEKYGVSYSKKLFYRVMTLAALAVALSLITFAYIPEQRVVWGIIHFFALVSLISPFVPLLGRARVLIALFVIVIGHMYLPAFSPYIIFLPFGWVPDRFFSADYYSLFPWIGYYLIGYSIAESLTRDQKERWLIWKDSLASQFLSWIGRHALLIYALHIPILYFLFSIFS